MENIKQPTPQALQFSLLLRNLTKNEESTVAIALDNFFSESIKKYEEEKKLTARCEKCDSYFKKLMQSMADVNDLTNQLADLKGKVISLELDLEDANKIVDSKRSDYECLASTHEAVSIDAENLKRELISVRRMLNNQTDAAKKLGTHYSNELYKLKEDVEFWKKRALSVSEDSDSNNPEHVVGTLSWTREQIKQEKIAKQQAVIVCSYCKDKGKVLGDCLDSPNEWYEPCPKCKPNKVVCSRCSDTHMMTLHDDCGDSKEIMCTMCPVPCNDCRDGDYCKQTPCSCECHL